MEDVIPMTVPLTDNAAVDWLKTVVRSYFATMKQLVQNTFDELYPESWSSAPTMTSQDMVVLVTAFCSLFGPLISIAAVYTVCKIVCWICVERPISSRRECKFIGYRGTVNAIVNLACFVQ